MCQKGATMTSTKYFTLCTLIVTLFLHHGLADDYEDFPEDYEIDSIYDPFMAHYYDNVTAEDSPIVTETAAAIAEGNPDDTALPEVLGRRCSNKPGKWVDLGGDFCYIIETQDKVSWIDAVYQCFKEGGTLASFHSSEEIKRILSYSKNEVGRLHIGLRKHNDGSFEWVDNSVLDFRNWNDGEPTYRSEKCVEIHTESGKWNDIPCDGELGYICSYLKDQLPRSTGKVCPDSSPKWNDFGGELCYIIEKNNETDWNDALQRCSNEGGSLASFHSVEEVSVLIQHTKQYYDRMHIGLQQNKNGQFEWADRSPVDFLFWDYKEPNDVEEKCGEMYPRSGQWNDIPCSKTEGYICSTPKVDAGTSSFETKQLSTAGPCGGDIISDDGTVNSPNYPENYSPNANCLWRLTVPENYQIFLNVQNLKVEYGEDCEFDYVEIYDGHEAEESPVLRKLCGSNTEQHVLSSGNKMSVKFVSDEMKENTGFIAVFNKVERCGGNIVSAEGILRSRDHPANYWPNDRCEWKIKVPDGNKVLLSFKSFKLEESADCRYDYVEILDGHDSTSPILGRLCGSKVPGDITSSGHKITVKFVSDGLREYHGFSAEFSKNAVVPIVPVTSPTGETSMEPENRCGGDFASEKGVIVTPNYPDDYMSYERCTWRIRVPSGYQVVLRFKTFSLEHEDNCNYDYIEAFDGPDTNSDVLGKFCGFGIPGDIISSGNEMTVVFKSDSATNRRGFAAVFTKGYNSEKPAEYRPDSDVLCGENIIAGEGSLQSPNYPENYESNQKCVWSITVPQNHQVVLKFLSFKVEIHDQCRYDSVEVRDGHAPNSRLIAKLCGSDIPQEIRSSRNKLRVTFQSDSSSEYSGFSAIFEKAFVAVSFENVTTQQPGTCGGDINSESGVVYSPNYPENYPPLSECIWNIAVPEGQDIVLLFQSFELEYHSQCDFDYVEILDGSRPLEKFCSGNSPGVIRSTSNILTVKFVSDDSLERSGFYVNFTTANKCGEDIFAEEGVIQSPNYPNNYGPGERCIWNITVPENNRVNLSFLEFKVGSEGGCSDSVTVFEGLVETYLLTKFCSSNELPGSILSNGNAISVEFVSDASVENKGFVAQFKKDFCGGEIFSESGSISTPNYPGHYRAHEECTWNITVPKNHEVLLQFESFQLEEHNNCQYDFVEIRDGLESYSPLLNTFCGEDVPEPVRSLTEKMSVRFKSDSSGQYQGFSAKFTKVVCGGDIVSDTGVIASQNSTQHYYYRENKICTWNITVPKDHQVVLQFQEFSLEISEGCTSDFVEIRDGHGIDSPVLGRFCGSDLPEPVRSSTEKMSVTFQSNDSVELRGFVAEFAKEVSVDSQLVSLMRKFPAMILEKKLSNPKLKSRPRQKKSLKSDLLQLLLK